VKTIFITSLNPFITRNILFTDVFKTLWQKPDLRLVVFCPDYKVDYFKKHFAKDNVLIEGIKSQQVSGQDIVFSYLGRSLNRTRTLSLHRKEIFLRNKNFIAYAAAHILSWIGWFSPIKKLVRFLDLRTISRKKFGAYFKKYNPDLVFGPDVFHIDDVHLLAEAKRRRVKAVGMVRSWDNITNKGLFRVKPDFLIVNNNVIRDEAIRYEDMNPKNIAVAGMPQFDYYVNESRSSREEFFRRIHLDPEKPLILFSPWGSRFIDTDWKIMQILKEARQKGEISKDLQFLIRIPPNDKIDLGDFVPDDHFYLEQPAHTFKEGVARDQELDRSAMVHLADSLHHSDLVIAYTSSLNIDACAFDKPIVGIAFDGLRQNSYLNSAVRFLDFDHTYKMLPTKWCPFVRSKDELIRHINNYLQNPALDQGGRKNFLTYQAWQFDGKSGQRVAQYIYGQL